MGGRSAGRSYVASQFALSKLIAPDYFRCAIMRFILGDVRNSIYREIEDRIEEQEIEAVEKKDLFFKHNKNTINGLGFRKSSGDQKAKLKSLANFNYIIIEEADEVSEEDFLQLDDSLRTVKGDIKVIMMLNPPNKDHWIIKRWFNLLETDVDGFYIPQLKQSEESNTCFIHTTYENNRSNLNETTIANFERYKETNPDHYYNMIKGLVSEGARGRILKNTKPTSPKEYEELDYSETYGLDFGFSNDPTSLTGIKKHNQNLYLRELIYKTGLTNQMISREMENAGLDRSTAIIYADSAEPKSIEELRILGWNVIPAEKGQGSVNAGLSMLQDYNIHYTEDSKNIETEIQNYVWALDRDKNPTNKPVDAYNHCIDGVRYNLLTQAHQGFVGFV